MVLCNHVLEHVPDDLQALREIRRVLDDDGRALLQQPVDPDRPETFEDWSLRSPRERLHAFGQEDHVRVYGRDFLGRLRAAGLEVEVRRYDDELDDQERRRYGLAVDERVRRAGDIYVCGPAT